MPTEFPWRSLILPTLVVDVVSVATGDAILLIWFGFGLIGLRILVDCLNVES